MRRRLVFIDRVLVAVGRRANGDQLDVEKAGVEVSDRGVITVDKQMRTNVANIFAIGDVVPGPMLAHKATHEAKVAAEVAAGEKSFFDARTIPSVAYTDPEIAWVGLTETEAKRKGYRLRENADSVGRQWTRIVTRSIGGFYETPVGQEDRTCSWWRDRRPQRG